MTEEPLNAFPTDDSKELLELAMKAGMTLDDFLWQKALKDIATLQRAHNALVLEISHNYVRKRSHKRLKLLIWSGIVAMVPIMVGWIGDWLHTVIHTFHIVRS